MTPEERERVAEYCQRDIDLNVAIFAKLAVHDRHEQDVRQLDRIINDRGFAFDTALAQAVIECDEANVRDARERAGVGSDVLASPAKLRAELAMHGVQISTVRKEILSAALATPVSDAARAIIEARLVTAPIAAKKLRTALRRVSGDGRIRDSLSYYAAHTGRWGGRAFQPQNLPRGVEGLDVERAVNAALARDVAQLRALAAEAGTSLVEVLASLVRPCVWAPHGKWLGVVDYSQVEARALAWLAGDRDAVALFREGRDPYRALASRLFHVAPDAVTAEQRKLGKIAELGCGYGMGPERFAAQAQAGGVDWAASALTPEQVVETWRDAHSAIAGMKQETSSGFIARREGLWQELQRAATTVTRSGGRVEVGALVWGRNGDCTVCRLPSGRNLIYREARLEMLPNQRSKRPGFTYLNNFGKREPSYGGKLAENVVQALCRDILAQALLLLESAGFRVVLHVHDEVVVELDDAAQLTELQSIMTAAPRWAEGLPLACEGDVARRYSK